MHYIKKIITFVEDDLNNLIIDVFNGDAIDFKINIKFDTKY